MYIAQTKAKNGLNIVDQKKRYFVSNKDIESLMNGKYTNQGGKPLIVLQPFEEKESQSTVKN